MLAFLRSTSLLFAAQTRRIWLSKRALLCTVLALAPVTVAFLLRLVIREEGPPPEIFVLVMQWIVLVQTTIPMIALIVGSAAVAEEVEDRTITYLLTRPIPRGSILVGRWLAGLLFVLTLSLASCYLTYALLDGLGVADDRHPPLPGGMLQRLLVTTTLASVAYTALFATLGTFVKHSVLVGLAYGAVIEAFLANLPGANQALTIQYYLKSYLLARTPELAESYKEEFQFHELIDGGEAVRTLLFVAAAALVLGMWRLSRRQFLLPS